MSTRKTYNPRPAPQLTRRALCDADVEQLTGFARRTLQDRRQRGLGPPFVKLGKKIVYFENEVLAWIDAQR